MRAAPAFLVSLVVAAGFTGCMLGGAGTDNPAITGSVTVAATGDWAKLRLGLFCASAVDTDPNYFWYFDTDHEQSSTDYIYRAGYWNQNDSTMIAFGPQPVEASVSLGSGLTGTFLAELPETGLEEGYYFVIAWLDADGDGKLDLVDSTADADQIAQSEFNRCPRYDAGGYYASNFYFTPGSGYQFGGFDGTNNYTAALSDASPGEFSFDLEPAVSGW